MACTAFGRSLEAAPFPHRNFAANPDVIVVSSLDRNRWALDNAEEKIKFLKSDPAVSQLDAVKKGHIVVMDGQAMNPTIRTIYGAEQVGEQLRKLGLN